MTQFLGVWPIFHGGRNTPGPLHVTETEIRSGLMGHLARMQTLPYLPIAQRRIVTNDFKSKFPPSRQKISRYDKPTSKAII